MLNKVLNSLSLSDFILKTSFKSGDYFGISKDDFVLQVCEMNKPDRHDFRLTNGYADFCKLLFVRNFTNSPVSFIKRSPNVYPYIRTEYNSRNDNEMPVLVEWASIPWKLEKAPYLMLVLYSRDQIIKEYFNQELDVDVSVEDLDTFVHDWYIVSIIPTLEVKEPPMPPITIWRNSLGVEYGGSGVNIDINSYNKSVDFWSEHIKVKQG